MNRYYTAIDDTDNLDSRGTGFRARELGRQLEEAGLCRMISITRHQLLVHPDIPYTSHNSSACLTMKAGDRQAVIAFAREYLLRESADGADSGLCVASADQVTETIMEWGKRAKREVITREEAHILAKEAGIYLEGLVGTKIGVIGSLAAVGLRHWGNDGRMLWLPGMREISGIKTPEELASEACIDQVLTVDGAFVSLSARIRLSDWVRPVMKDRRTTLYVEEYHDEESEYRVTARDFIKHISG